MMCQNGYKFQEEFDSNKDGTYRTCATCEFRSCMFRTGGIDEKEK